MAQYLISGVRHVQGVIQVVRAGWVGPEAMRDIRLYARNDVIAWLNAGHAVNTSVVYTDPQGTERWPINAKVELTRDRRYITTDPNNSTWDNLGSLPPC